MTLVDSNVLIDIVQDDPNWADWSSAALEDAAVGGAIAINAIVYAEISVTYESIEELDEMLSSLNVQRLELSYAAAFLAGKAHREYRRRGGPSRSPLPDFYIGAQAVLEGHALLTRDPRRYRSAFPRLKLIAP